MADPAAIHPDLWRLLVFDYDRPERPSFVACYHRVAFVAHQRGLSIPSISTLRRRLQGEIAPRRIAR